MGAVKAKLHTIIEDSATFSVALETIEREGLAADRFMIGKMWATIKDPKFECLYCGEVNKFTAYFKDKEKTELSLLHCTSCVMQLTDNPHTLIESSGTAYLIDPSDLQMLIHMPFTEESEEQIISARAYEYLSVAYVADIEQIADDPSIVEEEGSSFKDAIDDLIKIGAEIRINFWEHIKENCIAIEYDTLKELYERED